MVPWVIGFIAFMALEAVSTVYSNVLRDHVNKVSVENFKQLDNELGFVANKRNWMVANGWADRDEGKGVRMARSRCNLLKENNNRTC